MRNFEMHTHIMEDRASSAHKWRKFMIKCPNKIIYFVYIRKVPFCGDFLQCRRLNLVKPDESVC